MERERKTESIRVSNELECIVEGMTMQQSSGASQSPYLAIQYLSSFIPSYTILSLTLPHTVKPNVTITDMHMHKCTDNATTHLICPMGAYVCTCQDTWASAL